MHGACCAEASRAMGQHVDERAWRADVSVLADSDLTWDDFLNADGQGVGSHDRWRAGEGKAASEGEVGIAARSAIGWQET